MALEGSNIVNPDNFCLKWSDYQSHVLGVLAQLLEEKSMVDVTLCTSNGDKLVAHKIVLCAASSYFEKIFSDLDENHPLVILSEVETFALRCVLDFVYHGELSVHATHLNEVLEVAATLQIRGLTEVSDQLPLLVPSDANLSPSSENCSSNTRNDEGFTSFNRDAAKGDVALAYMANIDTLEENIGDNANTKFKIPKEEQSPKQSFQLEPLSTSQDTNVAGKSSGSRLEQQCEKRKRRESGRKDYSEDQLAAALCDLRSGQLLRETSSTHNIPRSTLYVRARAEGIPITAMRQEYSEENVTAAVQAVERGLSFQQASEMYQIPKTVLWRRVKAAGVGVGRPPIKRRLYNSQLLQEAIQALLTGQNLSRVSAQFQIPKTTLFREKARLIETGKLPWSSLKKRDPESCSINNFRLTEAVAACKEGKMSQAVASITYKVPKTSIWRRLQKGLQQTSDHCLEPVRSIDINSDDKVEEPVTTVDNNLQDQPQFTFIDNNSQLPVTYIVEEDFTATSLM